MSEYIRWLSELNKNSGSIAGGKGANLAEMYNSKFPVPPAFVITTKAYYHLIESTGIKNKLFEILDSIDVDDTRELEEKAEEIRKLIKSVDMPSDLQNEILDSYENLSIDKKTFEIAGKYAQSILKNSSEPVFVAVRSSATTEDLEESSFAGQQESYLNIKGNKQIIQAVKSVFASLFTARAIYYRKKRGFSKEKFALAVVVQKMIDSEKSGVMFSKNPIKNNDNVIIEAVYGLGEGIVSGKISPDSYEVSRELKILDIKLSEKKIALVRDSQGETSIVKLTPSRSKMQVLEENEIKRLADYAIKIEEHYKKPQDIEFSVESGEIYIVQSRPITTQSKETKEQIRGEIILSGLGASPGIASGKARIIHDLAELAKVQKGDILVTEMTNPDMVVTMQKCAGIVTDEGGITSHASIVSREMGIPAVVGTETATKKINDGQIITVDGFHGKVYEGETKTQKVEIKPIVQTKIKIKVILDLPGYAERAAQTKCDSIGLLRLEGIIAESGKHPIKFLKENKLEDYTKIIQNGIEKISEHFKEVWIRTSDIRSDEFSNLEGSPKQKELNPMLGMHGIRFSLKNKEILKSELEAVKNCAKKYPNKVFGIMIPQVISVEEVIKTKQIISEIGLTNKNIKIGIMVETPAACLIIKDLLKEKLDFISLGTNDLTQYTLAIDRGNEDVQYLYNELNPAVLNAIKRVLRTCEEMSVESSICGQAGSNREMVKFLVENNISSISVNADAAYDVSMIVSEIEKLKEENEIHNQETKKQREFNTYSKKTDYNTYNADKNNYKKQMQIEPILKISENSQEKLSKKENQIKLTKDEKIPEYVAETIEDSEKTKKEEELIKELFGENMPEIDKIETLEKIEETDKDAEKTEFPKPQIELSEEEIDEILDIF